MENLTDRNYLIESLKGPLPPNSIKPSDYVRSVYPIGEKLALALDDTAFYCRLPRGKFIAKAGQICPYLFLVNKGVVRGFFKDEKRELTTWICSENELVSSISSFFTQLPALEHVQTLEDCELTGLYHADLEKLYQRFPEMNIVARLLLQTYYRQAEERAYVSRLGKASERYNYFKKSRPDLIDRISLKTIASHLGITLETLSRLRSSMNKISLPESKY